MRYERDKAIPSKYRDTTPEENLVIWRQMSSGETPSAELRQYCVRGKIDHTADNKCLRDPVFYRFSDVPHHRLGDKYKVFPTYDWACPLVDSLEGVTHCLRTTEYRDRNEMYKWIIQQTGVRDLTIFEFSKLNFVNTVLSKRNLRWIVDSGFVEGWTDPRFPTVQGILRRGIQVQTLKDFMIEQGPSERNVTMEWDKLYSKNKDIIDPISKRIFAISVETAVPVIIENISDEIQEVTVDWHQKVLTLFNN